MPETPRPVYLLAGGRGMDRRRGPDPLLRAALGLDGAVARPGDGAVARPGDGAVARPGDGAVARPRDGREGPGLRPSVAYIGAASGDNAVFRAWIAKMLQKAGAGAVTLAPLCGRKADAAKARGVIEAADVVFVSGGDVEEGMHVLEETGMTGFLRELAARGKSFFGVSAGSIMLARQWVRWRDPSDDSSAELFPCLGIAPVLCDTHGEADGWEELKALVRLAPARAVAHGIVSGSALVVAPGGSLAAIGGEVHRFTRRAGEPVELPSLRPG